MSTQTQGKRIENAFAHVRCTMDDVRFGNLARLRRGNFAKQTRAECDETVRGGVVTKGREAKRERSETLKILRVVN